MNSVGESSATNPDHPKLSPTKTIRFAEPVVLTIKSKSGAEETPTEQKIVPKRESFINPLKKLFHQFPSPFSSNENESIPSERAGNIAIPSSGIDEASRFAKGDLTEPEPSFTSINTVNHLASRIQFSCDTTGDSLTTANDRILSTGADQVLHTDNIVIQTQSMAKKTSHFWPAVQLKQPDPITNSPKKVTESQNTSQMIDVSLEIATAKKAILPSAFTFNPSGRSTLQGSHNEKVLTASVINNLFSNHTKQRSKRVETILLALRMLLFGVIIIGSSLAIAFTGAVTSHSYNLAGYCIYGTAAIDGMLLGIYIITLMTELTSPLRTKDHLVLYTRLVWYHGWIFIQTIGLMLGLTVLFETRAVDSIYWLGLYKGIIIGFAMMAYCFYFRKKWKQLRRIEKQKTKKSFFYTEIYKQFLEELQQTGMKLKAPAAAQRREGNNVSRKAIRNLSINEAMMKKNDQWVQYSIEKTSDNKVLVISSTQLWGLLALIFLPFVQLFIAFGLEQLFIALKASSGTNISFILVAIYPIVMDCFRTLLEWINKSCKLELGNNAIFLATAFGALPFRIFFLRANTLEQAMYAVAIRLGYKILVYLLYGMLWKCVRNLISRGGKMLTRRWRKLKRGLNRKISSQTRRQSRLTTHKELFGENIMEAVSQSDKMQNFETLAIKFGILQICDIYIIIAFWIILLCFYQLSDNVTNSFNRIKPETYDTIKISSGIELGCEVFFWILVGLAWKLTGNLKGTNILNKMKEVIYEVKRVYFAANAILFFTFFLSLERHGYLDFL